MIGDAGPALTPLEIASGLVFGVETEDGSPAGLPTTPFAALETAVLPALRRPPCLVSFSGGRDSSCVLALAVRIARREGLPLPVPATLRFPEFREADEAEWQEQIVAALGLDDWVRLEPGSDLDAVGPVATKVLRGHGLLWPFNAYVHVPLLEATGGGSLLTGFGGDELLEHMSSDRVHALLARRVTPVSRDVLRLGLAAAPWRLRRAVLHHRCPLRLSWLRPAAQEALAREWATDAAREPRRLSARAAWWSRRRALRVAARSLGVLAADADALIAHPLAEPALAAAIFRDPELAHADRAGRLRAIFGDLLPDELYSRRSKASFNRAFFGPYARALVEAWNGEGVDSTLVGTDALRAAWREEVPDGRTYTLLQAVWLARAHEGATEAIPRAPSSSPPATTSGAGAEARTPAEQPG